MHAEDPRQRAEDGAPGIAERRPVRLTADDVRELATLTQLLRTPCPERGVADLERRPRRDAYVGVAEQVRLRVVGRCVDEPVRNLVRRVVSVQRVAGLAHLIPAQG